MRTKALLCAAAVAAGAVSAMAQSNVYSLNIVGYVNLQATSGYNFTTAPLAAGSSNGLNEVLPPNPYDPVNQYGPYDGDQVLTWAGLSWTVINVDSSAPTGFRNVLNQPIPAPIIQSGQGFLYHNLQGATETVTFVGSVRTGTNTVSLPYAPSTLYAAGSPIPFAGGVTTALQLSNVYDPVNQYGPLDGCQVEFANVDASGNLKGFTVYTFDTSSATGFRNILNQPVAEPTVQVGSGFFFNNLNGYVTPWTQVFNP